MWDYNEVKFKQYESMQHLSVYKAYKDLPHFITTKLASMDTKRMEQDMDRAIEYSNSITTTTSSIKTTKTIKLILNSGLIIESLVKVPR